MGTAELGHVEPVDVRTVWYHEAHDFTPWLAKNLDLLGDELGLKLQLMDQEAPVGPFSCDIHARETSNDVNVAIENQLEWTDHSHLTQLLTYTAGLDARIGVWVAPEFRYEHAEVLHWLNEWTSDEMSFYGVKVEAIRKKADSEPEARFRKIVSPGCWNKDLTQPPGATMSPGAQKHYEFFQPMIAVLIRDDFADKAVQRFDHTGRHFPSSEYEGIWYAASLEGKNDAWVTLHVETDDRDRTKEIFDALYADRDRIEPCFADDKEWHWRRYDRFLFSSINIRRDGSINDPPEQLEDIRGWMAANLRELKKVFDPLLADVLSELPDSPK